jgi:hypothetical protein
MPPVMVQRGEDPDWSIVVDVGAEGVVMDSRLSEASTEPQFQMTDDAKQPTQGWQ